MQHGKGFNIVKTVADSVKAWGAKKTWDRAFKLGDIKFGALVGTDKFGNEYFHNAEYPWCHSRWVIYKTAPVQNFDGWNLGYGCPSQIPPEWHSWIHYTVDEVPQSGDQVISKAANGTLPTQPMALQNDAPYSHHVGNVTNPHEMNFTSFRKRGYGIEKDGWNEMNLDNDPERFYTQPTHILKDKKGRHILQKEFDALTELRRIEREAEWEKEDDERH